MEQADCDPLRCGLVRAVPREGGEPVISHHYRERATGPSKNPTIATIYVMPDDFDLVAWIKGLHTD